MASPTLLASIGINKCPRESGFDRKNFVRKLIRDIPAKRNSYTEFVRWLQSTDHNIGPEGPLRTNKIIF
jgi:hypothetical protein